MDSHRSAKHRLSGAVQNDSVASRLFVIGAFFGTIEGAFIIAISFISAKWYTLVEAILVYDAQCGTIG